MYDYNINKENEINNFFYLIDINVYNLIILIIPFDLRM